MRRLASIFRSLATLSFLIAFFCPLKSYATGKYNIGFNEDFAAGYSQYLHGTCAGCPGNSFSASYSDISNLIYDLIANQHVGSFREIIPLTLLEPTQGQFPNNSDLISILSIYSAYNLNLTLSFGLSIPPWMSVNGSTFQIMPHDGPSYTTLMTNIAQAEASFLNALWNNPNINRTWIQTRVFVEGFNEFDSLADTSGSTSYATPSRAASLTSSIQYYINNYGVQTQQTSPSVVGVYSGYGSGVSDPRGQYMKDYYAAGGQGYPNFHVYAPSKDPNTTYQAVVNAVSGEIVNLNNYLPTTFRGKMFLSETGSGAIDNVYCPAPNGTTYTAGIQPTQRANEYSGIASDANINSNVVMLTFWRLMRLPPQQEQGLPPCEGTFGVAPYNTSDGTYYNSVGQNLFSYLKK